MRDWRYYVAKTWMNTLYALLIVAFVGIVGIWIYLMVTDPTLRTVAIIIIFIAAIASILNLLFKLTEWSENIIEKDRNGRN